MFRFGQNGQRKQILTDSQKHMYASEQLVNFRWISQALASQSARVLTDDDLVETSLQNELADIGQFAEVSYSPIALEVILDTRYIGTLVRPGFPLEGYTSLPKSIVVSSFNGTVANHGATVVFRPSEKQLVLTIAGTSSPIQAMYDVIALKHRHPSGRGNVHLGFWKIYEGLRSPIIESLRKGLEQHPDSKELVLTGHSMGGALAHYLALDILLDQRMLGVQLDRLPVTVAVFGSPRPADQDLVEFWRASVKEFRRKNGDDSIREYSVKAFSDGVPSLPPKNFGYRHFCETPLYLKHGRLFHIPSDECEKALFEVSSSIAEKDDEADENPTGGAPTIPPNRHSTSVSVRSNQLPSLNPAQISEPDENSQTEGSTSNEPVITDIMSNSPPPSRPLSPNPDGSTEAPRRPRRELSSSRPPSSPGAIYPRGGHNYYNGRDMERTIRRLRWLKEADISKEGWEERYMKFGRKSSKQPSQEVEEPGSAAFGSDTGQEHKTIRRKSTVFTLKRESTRQGDKPKRSSLFGWIPQDSATSS